MRRMMDAARVRLFMRRLGEESRLPGRVYYTGGATAILIGWRESTVDIDFMLEGEADRLLAAIPALKEELEVNVELASPPDFIPELPGWRERSLFIVREGHLDFFHYDLSSQALAKIERGHALDVADVQAMLARGLIEPEAVLELFGRIEPMLYRYPAIDPAAFRRRALEILRPPSPAAPPQAPPSDRP